MLRPIRGNQRLAESLTDDIVTDVTRRLQALVRGEAQVVLNDNGQTHLRASLCGEADYVLRGSIQGKRPTRVNLQLIHLASGVCVWADRCERVDYRGAITRIVFECCTALIGDALRRIEAQPTQALTLHDLLLQGHAWLLRPYCPLTRRRALSSFEQALATDPDSIEARLGIATALVGALTNGWSQTIEQDEARAETLLLDVMQAGTDEARVHNIYGTLRRLQGHLEESCTELEMAVDRAPRYAMALGQLGMTHLYRGRPEDALSRFEQGVRGALEDPQAPLVASNLGTCLVLLGEADKAIDLLQTATVGNPNHSFPFLMLAAALGLRFRSIEADIALRKAIELCPAFATLSGLRYWMAKQAAPSYWPIYEHTMERGLRQAGMAEE
jgi:Tfp pilus assembly protein PilF